MQDLTGSTVGRYEIERRLGRGGMGEVYEARDTKLRRTVAIKRLSPDLSSDDGYRKRFLKEAQHAARLNHHSIASIHDVLEHEGELLLVMEYVQGRTLRETLRAGPMQFEDFIDPATECVEALSAAHRQHIVHHDIKPENIMVTPARNIKILDFGVARRTYQWTPDASTEPLSTPISDAVGGTPAYMAPETLLGKPVDHRADIFALGLVFYESLTGVHPFIQGTAAATQNQILNKKPFPLSRSDPRIPAELERITEKMLAKDPAERYATSDDLLVDLRKLKKSLAPSGGDDPDEPKGIPKPLIGLTVLALLAVSSLLVPQVRERIFTSPLPSQRNLAILPFTMSNGDKHDTAFSRGLGEALTWRLDLLSTRHPFTVVPPSFLAARRVSTIDQIGPEVGADLALVGTITRSGSDAVVRLELASEGSEHILRTAEITGSFADPVALEYRLLETVMRFLGEKADSQDRQDFVRFGTRNPTSYHLYLQGLGLLQEDSGEQIALAIDALEESVALDESFARARVGLGTAYLAKSQTDRDEDLMNKVGDNYRKALLLEPELAEAQLRLGEFYYASGDMMEAENFFRRARYLEPVNDDALRGLVNALRAQGNFSDIEKVYQNAIVEHPRYWRTYASLGMHLFRESRFPEAIETLEEAVRMAPKYYRALNTLGAAHAEMGDWDAARQAFERSLEIRSTGMTYTNLGNVFFFQGLFRKAVETYQTAIIFLEREKRLNFGIYGNLGDALFWAPGQREKAAPQYRRALTMARQDLERNPDDSTALAWVATYHAMLGDREAAIEALTRVLADTHDHDPEIMYQAALVYCRLGDVDKAFSYLEKASLSGALVAKIKNHPIFAGLREDSRYGNLIGVS